MSNSIMRKLSIKDHKPKSTVFKVAVIGAKCVGKSALTVRMKTRKFIYDYAPNLESKCCLNMNVDGDPVNVEILDTAPLQTAENVKIEDKIRWADAFILVYSITDEDSLSALVASKCQINLYAKRKKKGSQSGLQGEQLVALVGNKSDLDHERMVTEEQGRMFAEVNECTHFFELSTRESYEAVKTVFESLYRTYRVKSLKQDKFKGKGPKKLEDEEETTEDELISAVRQRGRIRTKTVLDTAAKPDINPSKYSPVTFRRISQNFSGYASSPDEDHHFIGEEIVYHDKSSSLPKPSRRVTVHSPTPSKKNKYVPPIRRQESDTTLEQNNNQRLQIPKVVVQLSS